MKNKLELNVEELREQLKIDEGVLYKIYKDHLGYPTFGIGHLILQTDPEYGKPINTRISVDRINEAFETDLANAISDCMKLYDNWYNLPGECKSIIVNMMFNMGLTRLSKFKGMKAGVDDCDWKKAAYEMRDSKWYRQVPNRASRLVNRMAVIS